MNKHDRLRLQLCAMESPTFTSSTFTDSTISPMTNLALNLSGASLSTTPRRRLSLDSSSGSIEANSPAVQLACSPPAESRLLKNSIKLSSSPHSFSRARGFCRRINLNLLGNGSPPYQDKENAGADLQAAAVLGSPPKQHTKLKLAASPLRPRVPLEDHDPNSQDSGYGAPAYPDGFRFVEPLGTAPRRMQSPCKGLSPGSSPRNKSLVFHQSLSSGSESIDDGYPALAEMDDLDDEPQLPPGISSLLSGTIIKEPRSGSSGTEDGPRQRFMRSQSLVESTRITGRVRSCLFTSAVPEPRPSKRPEPPTPDMFDIQQSSKRRKSTSLHAIQENMSPAGSGERPILHRCFSENEATIKRALQRSSQDPDLIGDFSKPFVLPLMDGQHQDLKTISADTLAGLIEGEFNHSVDSYTIVDCRYPYEYDGGHIKGAKNFYTRDQIVKEFMEYEPSSKEEVLSGTAKRNILIFHCEFSSKRGPNLSRFLRNSDRVHNKECYPSLYYPEVYLLHGGYKDFFERHSHLCEPCAYRPMLHPEHEKDLRAFRSKSKSWNGDKSRLAYRNGLTRLGL